MNSSVRTRGEHRGGDTARDGRAPTRDAHAPAQDAHAPTSRRLEGEKARRIVAAMRDSMGARGTAGSTFDQVARAAGVSRGLLHYYFGSKERLLVEVVRHDCEVRIRTLEQHLSAASSIDAIVDVLVSQLEAYVADDPGSHAVLYELLSESRHSAEIQAEMAELYRRWRAHLAEALRQKEREGAIELQASAEAVASVLFALGDGMGLQLISDPDWDSQASIEVGISTARRLLGAGA